MAALLLGGNLQWFIILKTLGSHRGRRTLYRLDFLHGKHMKQSRRLSLALVDKRNLEQTLGQCTLLLALAIFENGIIKRGILEWNCT